MSLKKKMGVMFICLIMFLFPSVVGAESEDIIPISNLINQDDLEAVENMSESELVENLGVNSQVVNVEDIPEGAVVFEAENEKELTAFLNKTFGGLNNVHTELTIDANDLISEKELTATSQLAGTIIEDCSFERKSTRIWGNIDVSWQVDLVTNYEVCLTLDYPDYGPPHLIYAEITSANASTGLSGITFGVNYTDTEADSTKINDQKWNSFASGTVEYYLIIDGLTKYFSDHVSGSHSVTVTY